MIYLTLQEIRPIRRNANKITVFTDSKRAIQRARRQVNTLNQIITAAIHKRAKKLQTDGIKVVIRWVPTHQGVPENKEADRAVKEVIEISQVKEK